MTSPKFRIIAAGCAAALAMSGCAASVTATLESPRGEGTALLTAAVNDLGERPLLEYSGKVDALALGQGAYLKLLVARDGTVLGTANLNGSTVRLMAVDGEYFAKANGEVWKSVEGLSSAEADKTDDHWMAISSSAWFDAASELAPSNYAELLRNAVFDTHADDAWVPPATRHAGTRCHRVTVKSGSVCVSAADPHRIDEVRGVGISDGGEKIGTFDVKPIADAKKVESFGRDVSDAIDDASTVYAKTTVTFRESDLNYSCSETNCTFNAKLKAKPSAAYRRVNKRVGMTFKVVADGGPIGTERCVAHVSAEAGHRSRSGGCKVSFDPKKMKPGKSYKIKPTWYANQMITLKPDRDALRKKARATIAEIRDGL